MVKVTVTIIAMAEDEATAKALGYAWVKGAKELAAHAKVKGAARAELGECDDADEEVEAFREECRAIEQRDGVKGKSIAQLDQEWQGVRRDAN